MSNNRNWEYSSNPRLEGLLQACKYLKWENRPIENKDNKKSNKEEQ